MNNNLYHSPHYGQNSNPYYDQNYSNPSPKGPENCPPPITGVSSPPSSTESLLDLTQKVVGEGRVNPNLPLSNNNAVTIRNSKQKTCFTNDLKFYFMNNPLSLNNENSSNSQQTNMSPLPLNNWNNPNSQQTNISPLPLNNWNSSNSQQTNMSRLPLNNWNSPNSQQTNMSRLPLNNWNSSNPQQTNMSRLSLNNWNSSNPQQTNISPLPLNNWNSPNSQQTNMSRLSLNNWNSSNPQRGESLQSLLQTYQYLDNCMKESLQIAERGKAYIDNNKNDIDYEKNANDIRNHIQLLVKVSIAINGQKIIIKNKIMNLSNKKNIRFFGRPPPNSNLNESVIEPHISLNPNNDTQLKNKDTSRQIIEEREFIFLDNNTNIKANTNKPINGGKSKNTTYDVKKAKDRLKTLQVISKAIVHIKKTKEKLMTNLEPINALPIRELRNKFDKNNKEVIPQINNLYKLKTELIDQSKKIIKKIESIINLDDRLNENPPNRRNLKSRKRRIRKIARELVSKIEMNKGKMITALHQLSIEISKT